MSRRRHVLASALLALTCLRCSLLLYNDDELAGAPAAAGPDATSDAASDTTLASDGNDDAPIANDAGVTDAFPDSATVWSGNGHAYEVVVVAGGIQYEAARVAAIARGGHLATISSDAENTFVYGLTEQKPGSWVTEASFVRGPWLGAKRLGSTKPDAGWTWVTMEPFSYANWAPDEPNNLGGTENALHFSADNARGPTWNDVEDSEPLGGYVLEYE